MSIEYPRCHCSECQTLDKLPVRRHGIPHAWQPNMLNGCEVEPEPKDWLSDRMLPHRQSLSELDLPLFAATDQPRLF